MPENWDSSESYWKYTQQKWKKFSRIALFYFSKDKLGKYYKKIKLKSIID